MRFRVLGPLEVARDGRSLALGRPRQQAVLALLLVHANRVMPVDRFIDEMWGEDAPARPRDSLYTYVSNLRGLLGADRVDRVRSGYRLRVKHGELDAVAFEEEAVRGRGLLDSDRVRAAEVLTGAVDRWQGDAYQGIDFPSVHAEARRLEELRLGAVEDRFQAMLDLGQHREATCELGNLCERNPLRERMWGLWMLALYRSDRQAEALGAYRRLREVLGEELGIEPSREVQVVEERILLQDPYLRLTADLPHNLPARLSSLVGRGTRLIEAAESPRAPDCRR